SIGRVGFRAGIKFAAAMLGSLFVRSVDTAERVNAAMQARGFDGDWRTLIVLRFADATGCLLPPLLVLS
ncbi:MAG: CbiQ family ECF transporter T component, partial [Planctomycetota bacterium]